MSIADPTGERFVLTGPRGTAEIAQVGAALRALTLDGIDLFPRYPDDLPTPAAAGIVLVPWPNRIRGGVWTHGGETYQLAISEPKLGNASHGLLRFAPYRAVAQDDASVTLQHGVFPQTGYPFHLDTTVTYTLEDDGLVVRHEIVNVGPGAAPVAVGAHPYLCVGDVPTADLTIEVDAETYLIVDEAQIPTGQVPVDAPHDLRTPRRLGDVSLDTAYGDIGRDEAGRIRAILRTPDGRRLDLWAGPGYDYLQVFTTDRLPGHPLAVAVEPMTAPANAFNSGQSLRWLEPGESWGLDWGIKYQVDVTAL
ncbi:aldose 1-epimerase family protein [Microbacterium sp. X-17]|uniref:aldose 1-epimerase family protein n=1 Tax=Microbacterium sp. X-17 TaxID=3144404 RepID=UPI0031F53B1C